MCIKLCGDLQPCSFTGERHKPETNHALREQSVHYNSDFGAKNTGLRLNNKHFWNDL
jgi:hypothetical protein